MHVRALTTVPFLDVPASFDGIRNDVLNDIAECLDAAAFTNGPAVAEFEAEFADYCAVEHCVGLSSGLDALRLALQALGVVPGDEVLVPAMTFVATWEAVSQVGATPVPVDISPSDYAIDLDAASGAVGPRTRAVLPVHLYGQMCDPQALSAFGARHDVLVVEDACQAHGARRDGVGAGTIGDAAAFSFYPSKNLGAIGDAGALVTRDAELATRVRALREHGQQRKYSHGEIGWTGRLDTIQALVLLRKLPLLESWNALRREAAGWYSRTLAGVGDLTLPQVVDGSEHTWHVYVGRPRTRLRSASSFESAESPPGATIRAAASQRRICAPRARGRRFSGGRTRGDAVPVVADVPGHHGGAARGDGRCGRRVLREHAMSAAPARVIVLGKGELAVRVADWFFEAPDYQLVTVVPVVPEPSWTASLADWSREHRVPFVESGDYRDLDGVDDADWRIDLAFSVFYDQIIPHWFIAKCGRILNLHNSPLPRYRGVSPINWALKNGEQEHGVTIHEITPGVDSGPVVAQLKFSIYADVDEVEDVYVRALAYGWVLFQQTMPRLSVIQPRAQDEGLATMYTRAQDALLEERRGFRRGTSDV